MLITSIFENKKWGQSLRKAYVSGALKEVPELYALYGVPQTEKWHPEICTGWHMELCLDKLQESYPDASFSEFCAVLFHDLGKGITPANVLPAHRGHESAGVPLVSEVCNRFQLSEPKTLCEYVCKNHLLVHTFVSLTEKKKISLIEEGLSLGINFKSVAIACWADAAGRLDIDLPVEKASAVNCFLASAEALKEVPNNFCKETDYGNWNIKHLERLTLLKTVENNYKEIE